MGREFLLCSSLWIVPASCRAALKSVISDKSGTLYLCAGDVSSGLCFVMPLILFSFNQSTVQRFPASGQQPQRQFWVGLPVHTTLNRNLCCCQQPHSAALRAAWKGHAALAGQRNTFEIPQLAKSWSIATTGCPDSKLSLWDTAVPGRHGTCVKMQTQHEMRCTGTNV